MTPTEGQTSTEAKIANEVARALVSALCADTDTDFDQLCAEAGISPDDVEELRP